LPNAITAVITRIENTLFIAFDLKNLVSKGIKI